ncbi:hypothetical protein [Pseudomonas sp. TH10]|uniref:hypothetical protein n=1 Tax=Pseudomonas sp. TH10 TaxID=2796376 RepID=UPI0019142A88|nr:hypothetical protein [Pseudomonas sp. TH10]MBK5519381.1 hypothetical protein [Pseudomonas sp. TH10]
MSIYVCEREGFLHDVPSAVSTISAFAAGALVKIRNSPGVTFMVAAVTAASGAAYLICDKLMASSPPASDAGLDVQPPISLPLEERRYAAVPASAWEPRAQQRGAGTSEVDEFNQLDNKPAPGYRRTDSGEQVYRRAGTSEVDEFNQLDNKPAPGYRRTESGEQVYRRAGTSEVDDLNQLDNKPAPGYRRTESGEQVYRRAGTSEVEALNQFEKKPVSVSRGSENPEAEVLNHPVKKPTRSPRVLRVLSFMRHFLSFGDPTPLGK